MKKNILMMAMVLLIALVGFGSFLMGRKQAAGVEPGAENSAQAEYIGYAEYAGIYMIKELLPYGVYKECVLPHVQKLFVLEKITKRILQILSKMWKKVSKQKAVPYVS